MILDCMAAIQTGVYEARQRVIHMYHDIGLRILEEHENFERAEIYGEKIVQRVAKSLEKSQRTIGYAIQFARTYPTERSLEELPGGMNISWHKIVNKVLPGKPLDEECKHEEFEMVKICKSCNCRKRD